MSELKPCPFCGGEAVLCKNLRSCEDHSYETAHVVCKACLCKTVEYISYKGAIDAWNRRVEQC